VEGEGRRRRGREGRGREVRVAPPIGESGSMSAR